MLLDIIAAFGILFAAVLIVGGLLSADSLAFGCGIGAAACTSLAVGLFLKAGGL